MTTQPAKPNLTYPFTNNFGVSFEVVGTDAVLNSAAKVLTITMPDATRIEHTGVSAFESKPLFRA